MSIVNFLSKLFKLFNDYFQVGLFECGIIDIKGEDSGKTIFVSTKNDVTEVWLSIKGDNDPYMEQFDAKCCVSETMLVPGGFEFEIHCHGDCKISWLAIESE